MKGQSTNKEDESMEQEATQLASCKEKAVILVPCMLNAETKSRRRSSSYYSSPFPRSESFLRNAPGFFRNLASCPWPGWIEE